MANSPTQEGLALIKSFEGFRSDAYADPLLGWATPTIGYGTTVYANGLKVKPGDKITEPQALEELKKHVAKTITPALALIPFYAEMNDSMIGALESFAYNLGANFYNGRDFQTITKRLKEKDWQNLRSALMLYVNPGSAVEVGLRRRRTAEADLWEKGLKQIQSPPKPALKPGFLSANFALSELTVSQNAARMGLSNEPGPVELANLKRLVETCLQPLRNKLGRPIIITSGYRSPKVNAAAGGSSTSAHMYGGAADIHVPGLSAHDLFKFIHGLQLPVDQVIEEYGKWVHIGIAKPDAKPRNQYLLARLVNGQTVYTPAQF